LGRRVVEGEELLHQRERHPRLGRLVDALELQLHVGPVVVGLEVAVFLLEVEQRPRRDRDDQLTFKRCRHSLSS